MRKHAWNIGVESDLLGAFKAEFDAICPLVSLKKRRLPGALPLDPTWGAYSAPQEPPVERGLRVTLTLRGGCLTPDQIIFRIFGKLTVSSLSILVSLKHFESVFPKTYKLCITYAEFPPFS